MIPDLLPGDIILSRSNKWISKAIRWFGKRASGSARFSHAAMALGELTERPECIEALWKVTRSPLSKYEDQQIIIYRMKKLNIAQRDEITLRAVSVEQQGYGILKIPLFALDSIFKTYFFTSNLGVSNYKVCSNLIAWAYEKHLKEKVFHTPWRSVSPDLIDDVCDASPDEWETVYSSL